MDVAPNTATTEPLRDLHASDVNTVADTLAALVSGLQPGDVPLSWTPGIWSAFDRVERLAAGAKVLLDERLAESKAWERAGFANPAEYIANRAGTTISAARDALAASRKLADLPTTRDKVRQGALSPSQAHQITDAATHHPDAEGSLLAMTEDGSSFAELRDACGRARAGADKDPEGRRDRLHAARKLRQRRETDGAWSVWAQGTVTDAAVFNAAIEEIIDDLLQDARETGQPLTREQAAYDAMIEMANRINTTDWTEPDEPDTADSTSDEPTNGDGDVGDPIGDGDAVAQHDEPVAPSCAATDEPDVTTTDPDDRTASDTAAMANGPKASRAPTAGTRSGAMRRRKRPRRKAQPYLGIVRADLAALRRGHPLDDEIVEIAGVGPIAVNEAREILGGDTVLQLVLTNGVAANVTNFRRSPNTAQRTALLAQMPCCSVRGCPRTWTQIDHRHEWARTHVTQLEDLDPLCYWHHRQKTVHGWGLVTGTGKRAFVPPTHPHHPTNTSVINRRHPDRPPTDRHAPTEQSAAVPTGPVGTASMASTGGKPVS